MMTDKRVKTREAKIRDDLSLDYTQGFAQGMSMAHGLIEGAQMLDMNALAGTVGFLAPINGSVHVKGLVGLS